MTAADYNAAAVARMRAMDPSWEPPGCVAVDATGWCPGDVWHRAHVAGGKIDRDDMVELVEGYGGVADLPAGLVGRVLALDELPPERASEDVPAGLYVHVAFPRRGSVAVPAERLRLVLKARGEYVPVESIRKGDQVWLPGAGRLAEASGDADASRVHFVCVSLVGVRIGLHERPDAQVRVVRRAS